MREKKANPLGSLTHM